VVAVIFMNVCFITSAIFLKKIGSETHRVTQNLVGEEEVLVITMSG
jgi:hypothetical protein